MEEWWACYMVKCGMGMATKLMVTIRQAFELRHKEISRKPEARNESRQFVRTTRQYYNVLPRNATPRNEPLPKHDYTNVKDSNDDSHSNESVSSSALTFQDSQLLYSSAERAASGKRWRLFVASTNIIELGIAKLTFSWKWCLLEKININSSDKMKMMHLKLRENDALDTRERQIANEITVVALLQSGFASLMPTRRLRLQLEFASAVL